MNIGDTLKLDKEWQKRIKIEIKQNAELASKNNGNDINIQDLIRYVLADFDYENAKKTPYLYARVNIMKGIILGRMIQENEHEKKQEQILSDFVNTLEEAKKKEGDNNDRI